MKVAAVSQSACKYLYPASPLKPLKTDRVASSLVLAAELQGEAPQFLAELRQVAIRVRNQSVPRRDAAAVRASTK